MRNLQVLLVFIILLTTMSGCKTTDNPISHRIAAIEEDKFLGWPANQGLWQWGDEILVGFTRGDYTERGGHNIAGIEESIFTRSLDGGETWEMFKPDDFMDDDNIKWMPEDKKHLESPLNFKHEGFAMRVFATGYHGNDDPEGGFFYSYDRGSSWQGPYYLGDINNHSELRDMQITARTDYIVKGEKEMFLFISANPQIPRNNRIACIKTEDGGMSFEFITWVTPDEPDFNPIMSSTVQIAENKFIMAYRNRYFGERDDIRSSIEVYISEDRCRTWSHLSTAKEFELAEGNNTNPPALAYLGDERVVCVYGERDYSRMTGRYSEDGGETWGEEFIIRDNFRDLTDSAWDFGYPVLSKRNDGKLAALYYWASEENLQQHIAVSIWQP